MADVRRYLRQFLSDPRVIDQPAWLRWLLVNLVIAPFRAPKSAAAYASIWTPEGSPLVVHGAALAVGLEARLGVPVRSGMALGRPSLDDALTALGAACRRGLERLIVVPLFPQYASATTGSVLEAVYSRLAERQDVPSVEVVPAFWAESAYLDPLVAGLREAVARTNADRVILSFHGLPERQIRKMYPDCLPAADSCGACAAPEPRPYCYRALCLATAKKLEASIGGQVEVAFQSRLGRDRWLGPATADRLAALPREGVRRVVLAAPSFVADCLETLEELGHEGRRIFTEAGGEHLELVPCHNAGSAWVDGLAGLLSSRLTGTGPPRTG